MPSLLWKRQGNHSKNNEHHHQQTTDLLRDSSSNEQDDGGVSSIAIIRNNDADGNDVDNDDDNNRPKSQHSLTDDKVKKNKNSSRLLYVGLILAGTASSFLTCLFSLLHVQVFLKSYRLPLHVYSIGSTLFAIINTANDVFGAWIIDDALSSRSSSSSSSSSTTARQRHEFVGISGCLFALCFLTPFFRWSPHDVDGNQNVVNNSNAWYDGGHFVMSMSLYDTMFSFHFILCSCIINDDHTMTDHERVMFFACTKLIRMLAPMLVARMALAVFDVDDLQPLRTYLVWIAVLVGVMSLLAQKCLTPQQSVFREFKTFAVYLLQTVTGNRKRPNNNSAKKTGKMVSNGRGEQQPILDNSHQLRDDDNKVVGTEATEKDAAPPSPSKHEKKNTKKSLRFRQVVADFWHHDNFRWWIGMEIVQEAQTTYVKTFMKTFVDELVLASATQTTSSSSAPFFTRSTCDWYLSCVPTMTSLLSLLMFLPIRRYGYTTLYKVVFCCNFIMSFLLLWFVGYDAGSLVDDDGDDSARINTTYAIFAFMMVYPVLTGAIGSSGFSLAMADMVLEMKRNHAVQGRHDESSLAGLFMGVNALFCKPAESILPIITATLLAAANSRTDSVQDPSAASPSLNNATATTQIILFRLLVIPPIICSFLQLCAWSRYDLHKHKTASLRKELEASTSSLSHSSSSV